MFCRATANSLTLLLVRSFLVGMPTLPLEAFVTSPFPSSEKLIVCAEIHNLHQCSGSPEGNACNHLIIITFIALRKSVAVPVVEQATHET